MARLKSGGIVFEKIANRLMLALSENEYEVALNDLEDFIDENNEERGFLNDWITWWDRRREHFSKAYKNPSAPTTNISECYNSKYVRVKEINLKLVDAAKLDIAEAKVALRFERTNTRNLVRECPSTVSPAPHKGWEETLTSRRDGRVNTRKRYAMASMTSTKSALKSGDNGAMMDSRVQQKT